MKHYYALYKAYGIKTVFNGKEYGDVHAFSSKEERDNFVAEISAHDINYVVDSIPAAKAHKSCYKQYKHENGITYEFVKDMGKWFSC